MHMIHNCISYRAEEMRYDAICHQTVVSMSPSGVHPAIFSWIPTRQK